MTTAVGLTADLCRVAPGVRHRLEFWAAERPLVRKLTGLAAVDTEVQQLLTEVERDRLPLLARLVERLVAALRLAPSYSSEQALDFLGMLSSFEAFDQLFTKRPGGRGRRPPARRPCGRNAHQGRRPRPSRAEPR